MIKAQDAAVAAEENLKEVIKDSQAAHLVEEEMENANEPDPWEELIAQKPDKEKNNPDRQLAQYLQQALRASKHTVENARQGWQTEEHCPQGHRIWLELAPSPAKYAGRTESLTMDPYQFGTGGSENPLGGTAAPASAFPTTPPRRSSQPAKRTPVKEVGRALQKPGPRRGPAHEDKLEAQRGQLTKEAHRENVEPIDLDPDDQDAKGAPISTLRDAGHMD